MQVKTKYDIGDEVIIDGDKAIKGIILALSIRGKGQNLTYDVAWMHCGSQNSAWIEEWRLTPWAG